MTDSPARLIMHKFFVFAEGRKIYEQEFHAGLNVIRGDHAVGKSTLLDLIFYSLGGELRKEQWVYPADKCSAVCAEVEINGRPICFKRDIEVGTIPKIEIFDGTFNDGQKSLIGWQSFGARRSDKKSSFSQFLFELFGWGAYKTDEYDNLTMHQLLRLLYIDQETPSNKIFRLEPQNADSESSRQAIADFLLNLDDLELHAARQELLAATRAFEKAEAELSAIFEVLGKDSSYSTEKLQQEIAQILNDIRRLDDNRRVTLAAAATETEKIGEAGQRQRFAEVSNDIELIASKIAEYDSRLTALAGEIVDCNSFAENIKGRKKALLESRATFDTFGAVAFKRCPCCNNRIDDVGDHAHCPLCKSDQRHKLDSGPYLEILTELEFHGRQNSRILEGLESQLRTGKHEKHLATQELDAKKAMLRTIASAISEREQFLIEVARQMGFAESQVENLNEKIEIIERVDNLRESKKFLNDKIRRLNDLIATLSAVGAARRESVLSQIADAALKILEMDEQYEPVFRAATSTDAEIDFAKDRWLVDGRSKFSASSNVFKKNALHAAILAYSISDRKCRHPRFLILDDIENGGMTEPRSQNFQRILAALLDGHDEDCQVIISTAMVDQSLDNEKYGLGQAYKKGEYVIQLP